LWLWAVSLKGLVDPKNETWGELSFHVVQNLWNTKVEAWLEDFARCCQAQKCQKHEHKSRPQGLWAIFQVF